MPIDQTVLSAQDAVRMLGVHIETIRQLARKRDLPSFKIGKYWHFRKDA
jgi:excisionase family DNA binding protein